MYKETTMSSEVARIKEQIEAQIEAARRGMYGYATVSSHKIINHAFERIEQPYNQLASIVGPERARTIVGEMLEKQMSEKPTLLSIKQTTTVTTASIAQQAHLSIGDVYSVEIGGFSSKEKAEKVVQAFRVLSGLEIQIDDIRLNSPTLARSYRQ
jgi:hypothetical protein